MAALSAGAGFAAPPMKPLSSLGKLRPAPPPGATGPEGISVPAAPVLAAASSAARPGKPVDGIECETNQQLRLHFHVHLTLFVNGKSRRLPAGIGIWPALPAHPLVPGQFAVTSGSCFSWVSTHFADGVIHVEAPFARSFVLGEFFDVWGEPLGPATVGPARGVVTAIVDGKVWTGDPRRIPLRSHEQIQLEVGRPLVAPVSIDWPGAF